MMISWAWESKLASEHVRRAASRAASQRLHGPAAKGAPTLPQHRYRVPTDLLGLGVRARVEGGVSVSYDLVVPLTLAHESRRAWSRACGI